LAGVRVDKPGEPIGAGARQGFGGLSFSECRSVSHERDNHFRLIRILDHLVAGRQAKLQVGGGGEDRNRLAGLDL
jgi:hypothetical protein